MSTKTQASTNAAEKPSLNADRSGLLQRKCECGNAAGLTGKCGECQNKSLMVPNKTSNDLDPSEISPVVHDILSSPRSIQTKLAISEPGDQYEQEADRIADQIMKMPDPAMRYQVKQEKKDKDAPQCKTAFNSTSVSSPSSETSPTVHEVPSSSGQPLNLETRTFMESRLNHDFSQVQIHTDNPAAQLNRNLNSQAFTYRQNIYYAEGKHPAKDILTAHELVHVIQQTSHTPLIQRQLSTTNNSKESKDAKEYQDFMEEAILKGNFDEKNFLPEDDTAYDETIRKNQVRFFANVFRSKFSEIWTEFLAEGNLSDEELVKLFNTKQQKELLDYFASGTIPLGLFVDMETVPVKLTVKRRLLISAHILSHGNIEKVINNKTVEGKPKAENCGHWVQGVWIYAGLNPAGMTPSAKPGTAYSSKAITDQISFGTGQITWDGVSEQFTWGSEDRSLKPWPYTAHEKAYYLWQECKEAKSKYAELLKNQGVEGAQNINTEVGKILKSKGFEVEAGKCKEPPTRRKAIPSILDKLEVGDWIWVYNGNAAAHHSIMFAGWVDDKRNTINKRRAKIFHQRNNKAPFGDKESGGFFQDDYFLTDLDSEKVEDGSPVVQVSRVSNNVLPARSEKDLLEMEILNKKNELNKEADKLKLKGKKTEANAKTSLDPLEELQKSAESKTEDFIEGKKESIRSFKIDSLKLWKALSIKAQELKDSLAMKLSKPQLDLFAKLLEDNKFDSSKTDDFSNNIFWLVVMIQKLKFMGKATGAVNEKFLKEINIDLKSLI